MVIVYFKRVVCSSFNECVSEPRDVYTVVHFITWLSSVGLLEPKDNAWESKKK
jgi:hypothetical protein